MTKRILLYGLLFVCTTLFAGEWSSFLHVYKGSTPLLDGIISKGEYDEANLQNFFNIKTKTDLL